MNIVTTQYYLQQLDNFNAYTKKIITLVQQAKEKKADLLLLPEYAGLEIAWITKSHLEEQWRALQDKLPQVLAFFSGLAKDYKLYLQPGTLPVKENETYYNRAYFFSPTGKYDYQDKMMLTESEKSLALLSPGHTVTLFDTTLGKIGIAICYDSEFSAITDILALKNEATLILVPSYTDSWHAFHRVHLCCRARAIEYQCYVVQACANGLVQCDYLDETAVGFAGIFSPADNGFSENGIVATGDNMPNKQLIHATLSMHTLNQARLTSQVHNFSDHVLLNQSIKDANVQLVTLL